MRFLGLLAAVALLLSGCLASAVDDPSAPTAVKDQATAERTETVQWTYNGPPAGNINVQVSLTGGIGFTIEVPAGGATNVHWTLKTPGSTVSNLSWIDGPGCTHQGLNEAGQTGVDNELQGKCDDLPAGMQRFSVHTPTPEVGFTATIEGDVLA